jgi:L-fuconolactonase
VIDSHHHLWRYNPRDYVWMSAEMGALRRDFLPADLAEVTRKAGVDGTVAVQARQMLEETDSLLEYAESNALIRGVVGWVPLVDAAVERDLARYAANPRLKAVRHVLHDELDDFYMLREDFNRGIALLPRFGLVYDILIFERHLPQTLQFVDRHPNQVFVVDHIAKPRIRERVVSPWRENIRELARRENVYAKISGMATEADWGAWTTDDLRPYFETMVEAFGPGRLMFGSDWPVLTLAGSYQRWVDTFTALIAPLAAGERAAMCEGTASRAYGF